MIIRIDEKQTKIIFEEISPNELHDIQYYFKRRIKNWKHDIRVKRKLWDGYISVLNKDGSLPIGLWNELIRACESLQHDVAISKNGSKLPINSKITIEDIENFCIEFFKDHKLPNGEEFYPFEFQIKAVYKILKYRFCTINVGTGGGKSLIASLLLFYIYKKYPGKKTLLIVPTTSLVKQFYDDIHNYNLGFNNENENPLELNVHEIMSASYKPRKCKKGIEPDIYISTRSSMANYDDEFLKQIDIVIVDEAHEAVEGTGKIVQKTFENAKIRYGMSGTLPDEKSLDWIRLQAFTGPKVLNVTSDELINIGRTAPAKINVMILNHNDTEMHYASVNLRNADMGKRAYDIEKKYLQSSNPRMNYMKHLISTFDKSCIVLFHNEEYGIRIYEELQKNFGEDKLVYFANGNTELVTLQERIEIQKEIDFKDDEVSVLVASFGILSTGVSINNVHHVIFADNFKSFSRIVQSIGRGVRLHHKKDKVHIWDLVDVFIDDYDLLKKNCNVFYSQMMARLKIYKKERRPYTIDNVDLSEFS